MVWTLLLLRCGIILVVTALHKQEGLMQIITTIGLDLAKHVFQGYCQLKPDWLIERGV